ncbi:MAG: hypothetical protein ACTSO7_09600 [Candidatus Heimdallarchaeota archaeon]
MVSKTVKQVANITIQESMEIENYCSDCLYDWCEQRTKVTFCTMKTKGLFECRSCLLMLVGNQSELLDVEMNLVHDMKEVMTETP